MELKRLRVFIATAEAPSFRAAADRLATQISVISRTVAALEDELGVTLFERGARGIRLTEVGRVFLNDARRILADVDRARGAAQAVATGTSGRLRLAICEDATTPIFARVLTAFRQAVPDVTLDLFEMPSSLQPAALSRGEVDVGLLVPPVPMDGIELEELWRDPWAVAFPRDHPLASAKKITVAELAKYAIITAHPEFGPGYHQQTQALLASAGVQPRVVAQALHRQTMLALVQSGAGLMLVPGSFVDITIDGLRFERLQTDNPGLSVAAAFRNSDLPGVVAQFLRAARAAILR